MSISLIYYKAIKQTIIHQATLSQEYLDIYRLLNVILVDKSMLPFHHDSSYCHESAIIVFSIPSIIPYALLDIPSTIFTESGFFDQAVYSCLGLHCGAAQLKDGQRVQTSHFLLILVSESQLKTRGHIMESEN